MFGFRLLRMLAPLAVVCGALFAVSCGSNNSSPSSSPTAYPTSGADVVTLTGGSGTIPLPAVSPGTTVTLNYIGSNATGFPLPVPSAGITLSTTVYSVPPASAPAPSSIRRAALSRSNAVPITSVTFQLSIALPAAVFSGETLALPPTLPVNQPYFVELDDVSKPAGSQWIDTFPGGAVTSGTTTFFNTNGYNGTDLTKLTLNATDTYLLQFYYLTTGTPATPSPSPSPLTSPLPTPTPVVVGTTEPMGAVQNISLPVVNGGFVANVTVAAAGTSATSLTTTGAAQLPTGIGAIGTSNTLYPLYTLGFAATTTVPVASPAFTLQVPANLASAQQTSQMFGALCTVAACPLDANDAQIKPSVSGNVLTFAAGAFTGFPGVGTTPVYLIVYSSRATPSGQSVTGNFVPGSTLSLTVPPISTQQSGIAGTYAGTVNLSGLTAASAVTVAAQTGLFAGIGGIIPNNQQIFYALELNASPQVSTTGLACGSSGCSSVILTIPAAVVATVAATSTNTTPLAFYVEECSSTACPVTGDVLKLTANAQNQLLVPPTFGTDIGALYPAGSASTAYLVFYYQ